MGNLIAQLFLDPFRSAVAASDEQVMWRVRNDDDHEAFAQLVKRWQEPIRRLCTRMTGDSHRGEDLAQEAFVRLFAKRKVYEPTAKFSTYLWRIATNLCHDELRRRHRRSETSLDDVPDPDAEGDAPEFACVSLLPDEQTAQSEEAEAVRRAVLELPETYRSVLILKHFEDLKFSEIAEVLDLPIGTVKSRMAEAMNRLAKSLRRSRRAEAQPSLSLSL